MHAEEPPKKDPKPDAASDDVPVMVNTEDHIDEQPKEDPKPPKQQDAMIAEKPRNIIALALQESHVQLADQQYGIYYLPQGVYFMSCILLF